MRGGLEGCLESGWSLLRGKWHAWTVLCFCGWIIVLPTTMRALHWNICLLHPLANATSYLQPLDQVIIYCGTGAYWRHLVHFLLWKIDWDVPTEEVRKLNIFECHVRHLHDMGIHYACSNSKLLCKMCLWHCKFSKYWQWWINQWMGGTAGPHRLPQYFWKISECWQICPNIHWSADKFW